MKPGVVFVNVGRGPVVDEPELIDALRSGHVAFAALDVFAVEPLPDDSPLWDMPNVLFSPHSASTVAKENERIVDIFCHNLECYLDGRLDEMRNVNLSPGEGFILSRINGKSDIKSIAKISPLSELEALLVFWKLARAMHIHFVDEN